MGKDVRPWGEGRGDNMETWEHGDMGCGMCNMGHGHSMHCGVCDPQVEAGQPGVPPARAQLLVTPMAAVSGRFLVLGGPRGSLRPGEELRLQLHHMGPPPTPQRFHILVSSSTSLSCVASCMFCVSCCTLHVARCVLHVLCHTLRVACVLHVMHTHFHVCMLCVVLHVACVYYVLCVCCSVCVCV